MPTLKGAFFERSVTYICEHNDEGAMGLVINMPVDLCIEDLLKKIELSAPERDSSLLAKQPVFQGGPVAQDRGFVLHTPKEGLNSSLHLSDQLMVTSSKDILEILGTPEQPEQFLVSLGYAGWEAGQLEQEVLENSWLTCPSDLEIIFKAPVAQRWELATKKLGIDIWQLSSDAGHA